MMTEIHAKPSKSSRPETDVSAADGVSGAGKKRLVDRSSVASGAGKKKDKKKALKRL